MIGSVATGVALVLAAPCMVTAQETPAERAEFASQGIGLTMAYFEVRQPNHLPTQDICGLVTHREYHLRGGVNALKIATVDLLLCSNNSCRQLKVNIHAGAKGRRTASRRSINIPHHMELEAAGVS